MNRESSSAPSKSDEGRAQWIAPETYPVFDRLIFFLFVLALPPLLGSVWSVFRDGDVSWHVAAGRWILEHRSVPSTDPFSFTMAGKPWIAFEWGAEVIYAVAYNIAGFAGLAATVTLALIVLFGVVFGYLRERAGPLALLIALAGMLLVLQPFIMARPHVIALPFLAAWSVLMFKYRDENRSPPLALALLIFVWANIHGSYFVGFVVAAAAALDSLIATKFDRKVLLGWSSFGFAILVAAALNVNGIEGLIHPLTISRMETLPSIGEWHPSTPGATPLFYLLLLAVTGALLWKRPCFRPGELLLLLLTLGMAFTHIRHQSVFIVLAALVVTPKLSNVVRETGGPLFPLSTEARVWTVAAALAALVIVGVRAVVPLQPRETFSNPRGLIAHIPPELRSQPMLNEYSMGGPLILNGIRVYIDGRADMYGDDFFKAYLKMSDGDWEVFNRMVKNYDLRWTILQNDNRLVEKLDMSPDWRRIYSDEVGVIHVRRAGAAAPVRETNFNGKSK